MARDYLAISATGVQVERFFSGGPQLLTSSRQRLTPDVIRKCMCLRKWLLNKKLPSLIRSNINDGLKVKILGEILPEDVPCD